MLRYCTVSTLIISDVRHPRNLSVSPLPSTSAAHCPSPSPRGAPRCAARPWCGSAASLAMECTPPPAHSLSHDLCALGMPARRQTLAWRRAGRTQAGGTSTSFRRSQADLARTYRVSWHDYLRIWRVCLPVSDGHVPSVLLRCGRVRSSDGQQVS